MDATNEMKCQFLIAAAIVAVISSTSYIKDAYAFDANYDVGSSNINSFNISYDPTRFEAEYEAEQARQQRQAQMDAYHVYQAQQNARTNIQHQEEYRPSYVWADRLRVFGEAYRDYAIGQLPNVLPGGTGVFAQAGSGVLSVSNSAAGGHRAGGVIERGIRGEITPEHMIKAYFGEITSELPGIGLVAKPIYGEYLHSPAASMADNTRGNMDGGFRGRGRGRGRFGGFKRRRDEEEEPVDPLRALLKSLMTLGDGVKSVGAPASIFL